MLVLSYVVLGLTGGYRYSYDLSRSVMEDYNLVMKNNSIMKSYLDDLPASINAESCTHAGGNLQAVSLQYVSFSSSICHWLI